MKSISKIYPAYLVIGLINLLPIFIWLLIKPLSLRFTDFYQILTSLGQVSALVGFTLMATAIILSSRLRFFEIHLKGLNHLYIKHHLFGSISFMLLMLHPLVLTLRYLTFSTYDAAIFLVPSFGQWPRALGSLSLGLMMTLLFITFYLAWRYHVWKFSHRFLVLAFMVGTAHMAFITSDVSSSLLLRSYMLSVAGLALTAYGYRLLVEFGGIGKYEFEVSGVRDLPAKVREISLVSKNNNFKYRAGQFGFFSFFQTGLSRESHPFSFVSIGSEPELKLAVKQLGDYTQTLSALAVGTKVEVEGPYGTFGKTDKPRLREIWIAGGIGVTPFISLAKELINNSRSADLYVSFKNSEEAVYLPELEDLVKRLGESKLKVVPYFSNKDGLLTAEKVASLSGSLSGRDIYICGPVPMMRALKNQFIEKGVLSKNIFTEEFDFSK